MGEALDVNDLVRRVVGRVLAERGRSEFPAARAESSRTKGVHVEVLPLEPPRPHGAADMAEVPARARGPQLITSSCLADLPARSTLAVPPGARVTPLAREEAWRRGIQLVEGSGVGQLSGSPGRARIAVGADHGGFELKRAVVEWLRESGYAVSDLGAHDANAVDYPDFALAVARAVAEGRAELGICVDAFGIGSAIAANKVPGVRAAPVVDVDRARSAREHNHANVLTLGGKVLEPPVAFEIVRAFLATAVGPGRHAARVAKIDAIERRYGRAAVAGERAGSDA